MKCPVCGYNESKVLDSRPVNEGSSIRRRRECFSCQKRFTTYEMIDTVPLMVVKKDGSKEFFDKRKLISGLFKACYKRPVSVEELAATIESELINSLRGEIPSDEIGTLVLKKLRDLDTVSYIRYASVYREFEDIQSFLEELERLKKD